MARVATIYFVAAAILFDGPIIVRPGAKDDIPMFDKLERYLLIVGVFLAPMRDFRPTDIAFTFSDLIFCILGVILIIRRRLSIAPLQDVTILWTLAVLLLIGGLFASSILNGSAAGALVVCTQYFFAYAFVPFLILQDDPKKALLLVKTCVFSLLFIVGCGFIFVAFDYNHGYQFISGSGRLASFSGNANNLASSISFTLPLLLYLWFSKELSNLASIGIFAAFVVGLILTSSNTGLASSALAIACFLMFAGNFRWMIKGTFLVMIAVLAVGTVGYDYLPKTFKNRVLEGLESGDVSQAGTYEDRMALIVEATELLDGVLILGIGADQHRKLSAEKEQPVHNQYLLVWIEGGTVALIGWLLILMTIVIVGIRSYQQPVGAHGAAVVLSVIIVFIIVANTTPHLYARGWILPALIAMGVVLADRAVSRNQNLGRNLGLRPATASVTSPYVAGPRHLSSISRHQIEDQS